MSISSFLAGIVLLILLLAVRDVVFFLRAIKQLKDVPMLDKTDGSMVSVIIPARDEEDALEGTLTAILSQSYPRVEVIVVNDRSVDGTRAILEKMAGVNERLRVFHLDEVPDGWLGKTHALHYGAQQARGDYFLFADADSVMETTVIERALSYVNRQGLDHLVVGPEVKRSDFLFNAAFLTFVLHFCLFQKPWKAKDSRSKRSVGSGAFSLFRSEVYQDIGTMKTIALCVDDDLKLGKCIKERGYQQDFLSGREMVSLDWYPSVRGMIAGLTKNTFAVLNYNPFQVIGATLIFSLVYLWPLVAVSFTRGVPQILYALVCVFILFLYWQIARFLRWPSGYAFSFPVGILILLYIFWRSTFVTLYQRGIIWRGTFYSLEELRGRKAAG